MPAEPTPLDFVVDDLDDLKSLSLVASYALDEPSVPPRHTVERSARVFYGDFVGGDAFDLHNLPDTAYFGMPIWTDKWEPAMRQVYQAEGVIPPVPRMFSVAPPPVWPANDAARNAIRWSYRTLYDRVKDGGLQAFNAITQQTMRRIYTMLVAPQCDILEATRVVALLHTWLFDEKDDTLVVTPQNSNTSQKELDAIEAAQRRRDRGPDEAGRVDLPVTY
jgi:hypothetical protein